jgi:hypothetical protein
MDEKYLPWYRRDLTTWLPRWLPAWLFSALLFATIAALIAGFAFDYESQSDRLKSVGLASTAAFGFSIVLFEGLHYVTSKKADAKQVVPRAPIWLSLPLLAIVYMTMPGKAIIDRRFRLGKTQRGLVLEGTYAEILGWALIALAFAFIGLFIRKPPRTLQRKIAAILGFLVVAAGTAIIIHSSR